MLPPFIIDQIKKREREELARQEQPRLELPIPKRPERDESAQPEESERGVIIIEL